VAPHLREKGNNLPLLANEFAYWKAYEAAFAALDTQDRTAEADPAAIDRAALTAFIRRSCPNEDAVEIVDVGVASLGFSKRTLLVDLRATRQLPEKIVLRVDQPASNFGTTVLEEYPTVKLLAELGVPVPQPFALEATGSVIGQPFIMFARARGVTIGANYFPPPRNDVLAADVAAALVKIHSVPTARLSGALVHHAAAGDHISREITGFEEYSRAMSLDIPLIDTGFAWLRDHFSDAHGALTLVHNDYNYHNMLIENDQLVAVLDWEFACIGNPASDLGYHSANAYPNGGFERFLAAYEQAGGSVPSEREMAFYTLWGHLRMAMLAVQADVAYRSGNGRHIRHALAWPIWIPKALMGVSATLMQLGRDDLESR
jgi:aminoglycoside phosphotransferase (APT) family kinase protein